MKKIINITILITFIYPIYTYGQEYYAITYNPRLTAQLTANQGVRETSMKGFQQTFKKQKELYEDAKLKMTQVVTIHEHIYKQLYNVNSLFKQSKQVKYILDYIPQIVNNASKMVTMSSNNPQYAVWMKKSYSSLLEKAISLKDELQNVLLKSDKKIFIDPYDRDLLIDRVYTKVLQIHIAILDVINLLEFAKSRAYIYSIPVFGTYVQQDKMLVEDIMHKYKNFKYY